MFFWYAPIIYRTYPDFLEKPHAPGLILCFSYPSPGKKKILKGALVLLSGGRDIEVKL